MPTERTLVSTPPVVIGGLGGSGTRLVAQLVEALGYDFGRDRNDALDSRLFTLLFKRPEWFQQASAQQIDACLDAFDEFIVGARPSPRAERVLLEAALDAVRYGHMHATPGDKPWRHLSSRTLWPLRSTLFAQLGFVTSTRGRGARWGWKEPNAHVYLEHLIRHYPGLKYIHVVRNGMDMTLSGNRSQFHNWGALYDPSLVLSKGQQPSPRQALEYWLLANEKAVRVGQAALGPRFMLLNYDALCTEPRPAVEALCAFLSESIDASTMARLCALPSPPRSMGRRAQLSTDTFTAQQLERVRRLGFAV